MSSPRFYVGQTVLLLPTYRRTTPEEVEITRVGRKNVAITQYGREMQFNMETGAEVRSVNAAGPGESIATPEQYAESQLRAEVMAELAGLGVEQGISRKLDRYSTEALQAVANILHIDNADQAR